MAFTRATATLPSTKCAAPAPGPQGELAGSARALRLEVGCALQARPSPAAQFSLTPADLPSRRGDPVAVLTRPNLFAPAAPSPAPFTGAGKPPSCSQPWASAAAFFHHPHQSFPAASSTHRLYPGVMAIKRQTIYRRRGFPS